MKITFFLPPGELENYTRYALSLECGSLPGGQTILQNYIDKTQRRLI